jgi:hypothetical protein
MGEHILRDDQIIIAENWRNAKEDAGGCQCGRELYDAQALCKKGNHHWYYNAWSADLAYHCVRPGISLLEFRQLGNRLTNAYFDNPIDVENTERLRAGVNAYEGHPYVYLGCQAVLKGDAACDRGMHFLNITPEGRVCANPSCDYSEAEACPHQGHDRIRRDAEGREVARCSRCQQAFYDADICKVFGHKVDDLVDNPCVRPSCPSFKPGMGLYEALALAGRAGCQLQAVCREDGKTIAEGGGWNEKMKGFGIKKPKGRGNAKIGGWGRRVYQVQVRRRRDPLLYFGSWENYTGIKETQKTRWSGMWYPVFHPLPQTKTS